MVFKKVGWGFVALGLLSHINAATPPEPLTVTGEMNIYHAGTTATPPATACTYDSASTLGDGVTPPPLTVNSNTAAFKFRVDTAGSSAVRYGHLPNLNVWRGLDGTILRNAGANAFFGILDNAAISGMRTAGGEEQDRYAFTTGVFVGDVDPATEGPVPARQDLSTTAAFTQSVNTPLYRQQFFIGDGLTALNDRDSYSTPFPTDGTEQLFVPPSGSTRLYLGFADAAFISGNNRCVLGNPGRIQFTVGRLEADPDTGTGVSGTASTPITSVLDNDASYFEANPAVLTSAIIQPASTWPTGISLDTSTGAVSLDANVAPGDYTMEYDLCDIVETAICSRATVNITVTGASNTNATKVPSLGLIGFLLLSFSILTLVITRKKLR